MQCVWAVQLLWSTPLSCSVCWEVCSSLEVCPSLGACREGRDVALVAAAAEGRMWVIWDEQHSHVLLRVCVCVQGMERCSTWGFYVNVTGDLEVTSILHRPTQLAFGF